VGIPPELAILFGTAVAAGSGGHRRAGDPQQGHLLANITLAFAQMAYFFSLQAKFTGGEDGIQSCRVARC